MTKIKGATLRVKERQPLQDIVPLSHPLVMYLEPTNVCNFRCEMCPTGNDKLIKQIKRPIGYMPYRLWTKVIDDLREFDQPVENIHLFKDGESLLHPRFPDMLEYLRDAHVARKIWMKTNGSMLSPALNTKLIANGMDHIGISIEHVTEDGYKKASRVIIDYERLRENILDLYQRREGCKIYVKIPSQKLTPAEIDKFHADFEDRCDYIGLENYHGWSTPELADFTMGFNSETYDGDPLTQKIVCPLTLYDIAVNWDGTVSPCQEDWARKAIVGDVHTQSLKQIWEGDALYQFRKMHLEGRRDENMACNGCYYATIVPDNIDAFRAEILGRLR
jgi:radical SAM protein with 4Fe4S-binding SPASM domain